MALKMPSVEDTGDGRATRGHATMRTHAVTWAGPKLYHSQIWREVVLIERQASEEVTQQHNNREPNMMPAKRCLLLPEKHDVKKRSVMACPCLKTHACATGKAGKSIFANPLDSSLVCKTTFSHKQPRKASQDRIVQHRATARPECGAV